MRFNLPLKRLKKLKKVQAPKCPGYIYSCLIAPTSKPDSPLMTGGGKKIKHCRGLLQSIFISGKINLFLSENKYVIEE
jgi:hypothetical protein